MSTPPLPIPFSPFGGRRADAQQTTAISDFTSLHHPYEHSRLLLAMSSTTILVGLFCIYWWTQAGPLIFFSLSFLLLVFGFGFWMSVMIYRSRLLGNAIKVSDETLPELNALIDRVRDRLDYQGKVEVYVSDKGPMKLWNYLGVRVLVLEGGLVADLEEEGEKQKQLVFLLGSVLGSLKARQHDFAFLNALIDTQDSLVYLKPFLFPYKRATIYAGDQIGATCCEDVLASVNVLNRLLVGKELSPHLSVDGALDQALLAHAKWLPRCCQIFLPTPHLTNRYLNLLAFLAKCNPIATEAYLNSLGGGDHKRLSAELKKSPHFRQKSALVNHVQTFFAVAIPVIILTLAVVVIRPFDQTLWPGDTGTPVASETSDVAAAAPDTPSTSPTPTLTPTPQPTPTVESDLTILQSYIPASLLCSTANDNDPTLSSGRTVELSCVTGPTGPQGAMLYMKYADQQSLQAAFASRSANLEPGICHSTIPGVSNYTSTKTDARGSYACFETTKGDQAFVWTDADRNILGIIVDTKMSYGDEESWWEGALGL